MNKFQKGSVGSGLVPCFLNLDCVQISLFTWGFPGQNFLFRTYELLKRENLRVWFYSVVESLELRRKSSKEQSLTENNE